MTNTCPPAYACTYSISQSCCSPALHKVTGCLNAFTKFLKFLLNKKKRSKDSGEADRKAAVTPITIVYNCAVQKSLWDWTTTLRAKELQQQNITSGFSPDSQEQKCTADWLDDLCCLIPINQALFECLSLSVWSLHIAVLLCTGRRLLTATSSMSTMLQKGKVHKTGLMFSLSFIITTSEPNQNHRDVVE